VVYRFIHDNYKEFGVNWLLRRLNIYPNSYYSYLRNYKAEYRSKKERICKEIKNIYHDNNGVPGYRSMRIFLSRKNICISNITVHKYMNTELGLMSVVRKRKPNYKKGEAHKIFPNLLQQDFKADRINIKWCTDFTYLQLADGTKRYNCSVIDLHDRSVVASLNGKEITGDLAIRTVKKALSLQPAIKEQLILHSDQGSQFTSKEFIEFCESIHITQSMSKAGYPYDNAPMERYYNTLKNEMIYLHHFHSDEELDRAVNDFAYFWYNHVRPHSFNDYLTPYEARYKIRKY
jgi:transposase InsO family protein